MEGGKGKCRKLGKEKGKSLRGVANREILKKKRGGHYVMDEENSRKERWRNDSEGR